jgi:DNA (cytosine-5)-methyltransferase 1
MNYYNENNPKAAAWLRELIKANLIAPGIVDDRSIYDVEANDLVGFVQCHFFAGIGGWSYALRLAGWPDDEPVWTASCPCQPFSQAGKGLGSLDPRHLWPELHRLAKQCGPSIIFGEQVASNAGRIWLAGIRADLEALDYAVGCADLCAAGIGAPMVSQRLHWVAKANAPRCKKLHIPAVANKPGPYTWHGNENIELAATNRYHSHWWSGPLQVGRNCIAVEIERGGRKYRAKWRIKPGLSLLADGVPGRVAQLCGFGNAIVPQLASEFIQAAKEALNS